MFASVRNERPSIAMATSRTAIKIASVIHLLWGILLIPFSERAPRPFGGLEVYRTVMTHEEIAAMFIFCSGLAFLGAFIITRKYWFLIPLMAVPQQVLLIWAISWDVLHIFGNDPESLRFLFSLVYLLPITYFHAQEVVALWQEGLVKRMTPGDGP